MIPKRFEDIEFSDLEALHNNQVAESKTLEYKREISSNEKLLAGVSALANTVGGDFIIGIEAKDGIPINLRGVSFSNADDEILRLEQILQTGLEPRLPSQNIKNIQSPNGDNFIFIRVARSWIAPHRIKCKDKDYNDKFYGRHSGGKYPMDVSELRTAFMLSEQLSERIKNFRLERIKKIQENEDLPVELADGGKLVLHLVPLSAFTTPTTINLQNIYDKRNPPVIGSGWNTRINLDGVISYSNYNNKCEAYTQIFRNGSIESIYVFRSTNDEEKYIPSSYIENEVLHIIKKFFDLYTDLSITTPVYLFLSFLDVKDYWLSVNSSRNWFMQNKTLDRNDLLLPEIIVMNFESKHSEILRPLFDMYWNAYGYLRCLNYDEDGERKP